MIFWTYEILRNTNMILNMTIAIFVCRLCSVGILSICCQFITSINFYSFFQRVIGSLNLRADSGEKSFFDLKYMNKYCSDGPLNINSQDCKYKYPSFVFFICYIQNILCKSAMDGVLTCSGHLWEHWIETSTSKFTFNSFDLMKCKLT